MNQTKQTGSGMEGPGSGVPDANAESRTAPNIEKESRMVSEKPSPAPTVSETAAVTETVEGNEAAVGTKCAQDHGGQESNAVSLSEEDVKNELCKCKETAEKLVQDEDKLERFLERLEEKLQALPFPKVNEWISAVPMLISLVRAYIRKEYRTIPVASIVSIVAALVYFLLPTDLIPDVIPGVGHLDDSLVILTVLSMVRSDIRDYEKWQEEHGKRAL